MTEQPEAFVTVPVRLTAERWRNVHDAAKLARMPVDEFLALFIAGAFNVPLVNLLADALEYRAFRDKA